MMPKVGSERIELLLGSLPSLSFPLHPSPCSRLVTLPSTCRGMIPLLNRHIDHHSRGMIDYVKLP